MNLELLGDLVILTALVSGTILFITVNIMYEPNKSKADEKQKRVQKDDWKNREVCRQGKFLFFLVDNNFFNW